MGANDTVIKREHAPTYTPCKLTWVWGLRPQLGPGPKRSARSRTTPLAFFPLQIPPTCRTSPSFRREPPGAWMGARGKGLACALHDMEVSCVRDDRFAAKDP